MSVTSCQQKIPLFHKYYNIFPIDVTPLSAENVGESIIYTFFVLDRHLGLTFNDIADYMVVTFPKYSLSEVKMEIDYFVRKGVLVTLQPICRDWCADECPVKAYSIGSRLDQLPEFSDLIMYLMQLAGGTRTTSTVFNHWFLPNRNLQGGVTSTKRSVMSTVCV